jgi:hypothetical protein
MTRFGITPVAIRNSPPRSIKQLAPLDKSATEDCGLAFFRSRLVLPFQFRQVCQ